jgi:two-component system LytT family response regulator
MIRTVIIEEDKDRRERMAEIIHEKCPDVFLLSLCVNTMAAMPLINEYDPDLVISNTRFNKSTIFELVNSETLTKFNFRLILLSETEEFAYQAIKVHSADYLMLPLDEGKLIKSINKVKGEIQKEIILQSYLLSDNLFRKQATNGKIVLKSPNKIVLIPIKDIIYCNKFEGNSNFYLSGGKCYDTSEPFEHFSELLSGHGFIKINKSFMVNGNYLEQFEKADGGYVVLREAGRIPVNDRAREQFNRMFMTVA